VTAKHIHRRGAESTARQSRNQEILTQRRKGAKKNPMLCAFAPLREILKIVASQQKLNR